MSFVQHGTTDKQCINSASDSVLLPPGECDHKITNYILLELRPSEYDYKKMNVMRWIEHLQRAE